MASKIKPLVSEKTLHLLIHHRHFNYNFRNFYLFTSPFTATFLHSNWHVGLMLCPTLGLNPLEQHYLFLFPYCVISPSTTTATKRGTIIFVFQWETDKINQMHIFTVTRRHVPVSRAVCLTGAINWLYTST